MLVLGRKLGESIMIGRDIRIIVSRIEDGKVRLAVDAPRSVEVCRSELLPKKEKENDEGTEK